MSQPIEYRWRGPVTDAEMVALVTAHGGRAAPGRWDQIRPHSLGWVTARQPDGALAGFVNVAWDGGDHAFLLDTKVATKNQRQGIATALVGHAARHAKAAGCEWLHVDFEQHLARFYLDACGFRPATTGLIQRFTQHRLAVEGAADVPLEEILEPADRYCVMCLAGVRAAGWSPCLWRRRGGRAAREGREAGGLLRAVLSEVDGVETRVSPPSRPGACQGCVLPRCA